MPLNDALFNRLVQRFGAQKVSIVRDNEPYIPNWQFNPITGQQYREPVSSGEAYKLDCPYCNDKKGRLYVNHFWMQWDPDALRHADDMIRCFNEKSCFSDPERRKEFFHFLFGDCDPSDLGAVKQPENYIPKEVKAEPPGKIVSVSALDPRQPCRRYLTNRGYDVNELAQWWNVGYVTDTYYDHPSICHSRIYIPLYHNGQLVGYQCRYVGDREWTRDCPKSLTMPHMKRGRYLYNYDVAKRSKVVVIVEGPTSAWSVGVRSVALWGKTITVQQIELINAAWGKDCLVVVMLDNDAALDSDKMVMRLRTNCQAQILQVKLMTPGEDPGTLGREKSWQLIAEECQRRGIDLASYAQGENVASAI